MVKMNKNEIRPLFLEHETAGHTEAAPSDERTEEVDALERAALSQPSTSQMVTARTDGLDGIFISL